MITSLITLTQNREREKKIQTYEPRKITPEPHNLASGAHTTLNSLITKSLGHNGRTNLDEIKSSGSRSF
jgi:hypothetical protein